MKSEILKKYNKMKTMKLISALLIDLLGLTTYFLPVIGESGDWVWGPISGILIFMLFPNRKYMVFSGIMEEMLPFTDFIPTAYLTWRLDYVKDRELTLSDFVRKEMGEEQLVQEILNAHHRDTNNVSK